MDDRPWLKYYDYWVPASINYPHIPLSRLLLIASIIYPQHKATLFYDAELTYMQLRTEVTRLAAALQDLGLGKGDHIGIMLPNSPQYIIAFYAVQWIGATAVNMSTLWVAREVSEVIRQSEISVLIVEASLAAKAFDMHTDVQAESKLAHIITVGLEAYMSDAAARQYREENAAQGHTPNLPDQPWHHHWADLMQTAPRPFDVDIDPEEDVAVIQYTGGTAGKLKAAMLTHYGLVINVVQAAKWGEPYTNDGNETTLCVVPFSHAYGMNLVMNRAIFHGYRMALVPRFDVNLLVDTIEKYHPSHFYAVPALIRAIMNRRMADQDAIKSLKFVTSGASPLPRDLMFQYEARMNGMFTEGYGLTEACLLMTMWPILNEPNRESVGLPYPDVFIKIMDAESGTRALPTGEVGEIVINAPQVMKGYWKQPEETARVLRRDAAGQRWLYSGDLGYMDEKGYLYVVGRKKDMIIVAGFNVYPNEVELVLAQHPAVQEVAVVGVPDKARGERIYAYVVLDPEAEVVSTQALIEHCKANLAAYKVPRRVIFRTSLPKSGIGKVVRAELVRQELEAARHTDARPDFMPAHAPAEITPEAYFTEFIPRAFAAYVDANPPCAAMEGSNFVVAYTVGDATFGIHVGDGRHMTVSRTTPDAPTIATRTDLDSWRDSVTGLVFTGLAAIAQGATALRLAKLAEVHGTVHLELTRDDGTLYRASVTYNGDTATSVTVQMSTHDYSAMSRGEISGIEALLAGKLRAHGDMGFLQVLATLRE